MKTAVKTIPQFDSHSVLKVKKAMGNHFLDGQTRLSKWRRRPVRLFIMAATLAVLFVYTYVAFSPSGAFSMRNASTAGQGGGSPGIVEKEEVRKEVDGGGDGGGGGGGDRTKVTSGASEDVISPKLLAESLKHLLENKLPTRTSSTEIPKWCKQLKSKPLPGTCKGQDEEGKCPDGKSRFFSQFRQDYLLYVKHFRYLSRPGVYVDVAANHPRMISNTYFYDKCMNWKGICVEANPAYAKGLEESRSCAFVPTCVSDKEERVSFRFDGGYGGINKTNKNWKSAHRETVDMTCTTLKKVFANVEVKHIDYMSLDVEGHELYVLKGIDWSRTSIDILTVETRTGTPTDKFLLSLGYNRYLPEDPENYPQMAGEQVYIAPGVVVGKPF